MPPKRTSPRKNARRAPTTNISTPTRRLRSRPNASHTPDDSTNVQNNTVSQIISSPLQPQTTPEPQNGEETSPPPTNSGTLSARPVPRYTPPPYRPPTEDPVVSSGRTSIDWDRLTPHRPGSAGVTIRWTPRSSPRGVGQLDEFELPPPPEILEDNLEEALKHQQQLELKQFAVMQRIEEVRMGILMKEREFWERWEGYEMLESSRVEFWEWWVRAEMDDQWLAV